MQTSAKLLAIRVAGVFGPRTDVVANSNFTRDLFLKRFPLPDERVRVTSLGVSGFWLGTHAPRLAVRQRLDIPGDAIVMVTVARLTRRKGQLLTLNALAAVPKHVRKRIVWLVIGPDGEPDYVAELKAAAKASKSDIRFLGALPDETIRDIYGAADFFCLTGLHEQSGRVEGFGLAYLEAAACGLPSVATAVGGVPDAVITGTTGILVDPIIDSVAAAIAVMGEEVEKRLWLGKGATAHARAMSWERCAAATYGLTPDFDTPMRPARSRSTMP
jgi:glycosyltransferase involved in cell wall biosynthesis